VAKLPPVAIFNVQDLQGEALSLIAAAKASRASRCGIAWSATAAEGPPRLVMLPISRVGIGFSNDMQESIAIQRGEHAFNSQHGHYATWQRGSSTHRVTSSRSSGTSAPWVPQLYGREGAVAELARCCLAGICFGRSAVAKGPLAVIILGHDRDLKAESEVGSFSAAHERGRRGLILPECLSRQC